MAYLYPLLLYTCLGGGLLLLTVAVIPWLRPLCKPMTAAWFTVATLLWLMLPSQGRWVLSIWSPGAVLGGQVILDMTPAIWWLGLVLNVAFCGAAWIEVADRRDTLSLSGALSLIALLTIWLCLSGGSLLTTLATWAVFDLVWGVAGLTSGAEGERVTFGLAVHGMSSLLLWATSLLLLQGGTSSLWWLMWPSVPLRVLLVFAAVMRIGFYPFQIVFPQGLGKTRSLGLVYLMGPMTGLALLYRVLELPNMTQLSPPFVFWGLLSLLWCGLMAWSVRRRQALFWAAHALLIGLTACAMSLVSGTALIIGAIVWVAGGTLLVFARSVDPRAIAWSWPAWIAVLFFLGAPPSPIGTLYRAFFQALPWLWRLPLFISIVLIGAIFLRGVARAAAGSVTPPWPWQYVSLITGMGVVLLALFASTRALVEASGDLWSQFSWVGLGLWFLATLGAVALARWGRYVQELVQRGQPVMTFLNFQWFYRAIWQGAQHLLSVVRASAEVVEGSGAMLWSLLILLLILLVITSR